MTEQVFSLVRERAGYPYEAVRAGVVAAGDRFVDSAVEASVCLTWNSYGGYARVAQGVVDRGGRHVVIENGYVARDRGYYLMERGGFNGRGEALYKNMPPDRWERLGETIEPWRTDGEYVLVVGQRGGGYSELAMPNGWPENILFRLRERTNLPLYYRPHPSRQRIPQRIPGGTLIVSSERSLDDQIRRAWVVVGYTSSAMVRALQLGVPTVFCGPAFILGCISGQNLGHIENPVREDREQAFWDLAWCQWHVNEIKDGTAWRAVAHA